MKHKQPDVFFLRLYDCTNTQQIPHYWIIVAEEIDHRELKAQKQTKKQKPPVLAESINFPGGNMLYLWICAWL